MVPRNVNEGIIDFKVTNDIVENILEPNAILGKDFQARTIVTTDGLVVTGFILKETDSAIIMQTANATQIIARYDIEKIGISTSSFIHEDILKPLNDRERIELMKYLMSLKSAKSSIILDSQNLFR